jgi:hypothetical protein
VDLQVSHCALLTDKGMDGLLTHLTKLQYLNVRFALPCTGLGVAHRMPSSSSF